MELFIKISTLLVILLESSLPSQCRSFEQSIVNGRNASLGEALYQVYVRQELTETARRTCGGVLFKGNKVLTAAHCIMPGDGDVYVRYGTKDRSNETYPDVGASYFVQHPGWDPEQNSNDLAVITLERYIRQDSRVRNATFQSRELSVGESVTIYGWGTMSGDDDEEYPDHLQKTTLYIKEIDETRTLASSNTSIACDGDSGSAMSTSDGRVAGIASTIVIGCEPSGMNCYTKVSAYLDWINSQ